MLLDISVVKLFHYFLISQQLQHILLMLALLRLQALPTSEFLVKFQSRGKITSKTVRSMLATNVEDEICW